VLDGQSTKAWFFQQLGYETAVPRTVRRSILILWPVHDCAQAVAIRGASHVARRHAAVPRALQLRVALDDWERNDVHERVRA